MSSLLYRLGRFAFRRRWTVLLAWLIAAVGLFMVSVVGGGKLVNDFSIPGTESQQGLDMLSERFPQVSGATAQLVIEAPEGQQVTDPANEQAIDQIVSDIEGVDGVELVSPVFGDEAKDAVSDDGRYAQATIQLVASAGGISSTTLDALEQAAVAPPGSDLAVQLGGAAFSTVAFGLSATEVIGVGFAFLVMALTFGSLLMAGMPLLTACIGIGVSTAGILAVSVFTSVSSMTPTLAMMIGLAVGIDYALFIGTRYRHELSQGAACDEAAGRAIATAGSAVVFAGSTVTIALCALTVVGIPILSVIGVAAGVTVALAVCVALTVLPALFALFGERLRPKPGSRAARRETADPDEAHTMGARWVRVVTKAPWVTVAAVIAIGVLAALPARDLTLSLPDNGSSAQGSRERETYDMLSEGFGPGFNAPLLVVGDIVGNMDPLTSINGLADAIGEMPGVAAVTLATPNASLDTALIRVMPTDGQTSQSTKDLVADLRAAAPGFEQTYDVRNIMVTGLTAVTIDVSSQLSKALLPFGVVVVGLSLILLTIVFRSIAVPIKASLGYVLSVLVAFGATTVVFEWGWGADLLNVPKVGPVASFLPIILMGVLFGLAMDYEVFLVSRMHEDFQRTGRPRRAIYSGFAASARVVTAAAIIMLSVFVGFIPHGDAFVQPIAFALGVGVLFDAFFVRMTLVPAVMALLGKSAWWLPAWLSQRLPQLDVEGRVLEHRLEHQAWQREHGEAVVRTEGLVLATDPDDVRRDIVVRPHRVTALVETDASRRRELLAVIAGRARLADGLAVVGGDVLPDQAAAVRHQVSLVPAAQESPSAATTVGDYLEDNLTVRAWWPWQRRRAAQSVLTVAQGLAPQGADLRVATPLRDLTVLQRRLLDLAVSVTSSAPTLVIDDVDALRVPGESAVLWGVLADLAEQGRTVVAGVRTAPDVAGVEVVDAAGTPGWASRGRHGEPQQGHDEGAVALAAGSRSGR